ncbi:uncharacterized protein LOC120423462 [Culex pipiens pallens]|uniref:uncharacterized protein LOC120423462 n=1 Tax=Culex pipiens pallens TaxID=42434 RepID=UPI0022AB0608|nr:uncharacterized protein LOC120423462 [Culex pipiens pallens]
MAQRPPHNFTVLLLRKKVHTKRVPIAKSIEEFCRNNPDKTPLILVDLMHIDQIQFGDRNETRYRDVCGPNLGQVESFESVFRFLQSRQCRLVFFVDGPDNRDLHEAQFSAYWTCRKDERYGRDMALIDALLERDGDYREGLKGFRHIPTDRILFDSIVSTAKQYGDVVHGLENSRLMEMARYVVDHPETLAVLGKSSSVLLTADSRELKLWYLPEFNAETMMVTELDSGKVWDEMGLQSKEKRLLMVALLPGSYVGSHAASEDVHKTHAVVKKLPEVVREEQYKDVVRKLFARTGTTWEQLKLACELYDVNQITPSEQTDERLTSFAYDITHNRTSIITVMLNDYRYWTERSVDFYQLFVRFYGRLAGVVLKRSGAPTEEAVQRRIFIKRSHEDKFKHEMIDVEFPDFDFEREGKDDSVTETTLACLKFILDFEDMTAIRAFADEDKNRWKLLDYVTVQFMIKEQMISETLAATIMTAVDTSSSETPALVSRLDLDAFHATFMYVRWRQYVREALVNAGFPDAYVDDMCRLDGSRLQLLVQQGGSDAGQNAPS